MLDVNNIIFNSSIQTTFFEPYPERLFRYLTGTDKKISTIIENQVQEVPLGPFLMLEENDILFVGSWHVVKVGIDVNYIVFEVLPRL